MTEEDEIAALFAAPPAAFIALRKDAAARLRAAGDKAAATRVASLSKPTPAAWAVDALARAEPGRLARLFDVGARLREALRESFAGRCDVAAPTALQREQRDLASALAASGAALLSRAGGAVSPAVVDRIATTLRTLSTTGSWGDAAPGRLTKELGEADVTAIALLLVDDARPRATAAPPRHPPDAASSGTRVQARPRSQRGAASAAPSPDDAEVAAESLRLRQQRDLARAALAEVARAERDLRASAEADARAFERAVAARAEAEAARSAAELDVEALRRAAAEATRVAAEAASKAAEAAHAVDQAAEGVARQSAAAEVARRAEEAAARTAAASTNAAERAAEQLARAQAALDALGA